jgi:hypothetical protein
MKAFNETNSTVLAAAKAIRTLLECQAAWRDHACPSFEDHEVKTRLDHIKEHCGVLSGGGRVHKGLVEQVTIKTNLPGAEWLEIREWDMVAEQCDRIGIAFDCLVEIDDNALRGHRNRLEVTVTHRKMQERIDAECFDNGSA